MSTGRSNSDLIQAAMAGDGGAFADLVRPEYTTAVRLAYALLHDLDDAEDAVQEASLKAWRKLRNVKPGAPLKPWYLAIVANQCRSVRRTKSWSTRSDEPVPEQQARAVDVAASVDLRRGLARLGHDDRLALVLRYYLDLPFDDIAATLGITPNAARSRVERAVQRLRPMLRMQEALS